MFRVIEGTIRPGMRILFMDTDKECEVDSLGVLTPKPREIDQLSVGEVGFLAGAIKTVSDVEIGDTITEANRPTARSFPRL